MTTDEELSDWPEWFVSPWFIVLVFVLGYAIAYLYHLKETVVQWCHWLRR